MQNKRLITILLTSALILLIPLIAMQFTDEVNWALADFLIAGVLLISTGLFLDLANRKISKSNHKIAISILIVIAFLMVWAELAVGVFGTPFAGS